MQAHIIAMDEEIAFLKSQDTINYAAAKIMLMLLLFLVALMAKLSASLHQKISSIAWSYWEIVLTENASYAADSRKYGRGDNAQAGWREVGCQQQIKSVYLRGIDQKRQVADNSDHFQHYYGLVSVIWLILFLMSHLNGIGSDSCNS